MKTCVLVILCENDMDVSEMIRTNIFKSVRLKEGPLKEGPNLIVQVASDLKHKNENVCLK